MKNGTNQILNEKEFMKRVILHNDINDVLIISIFKKNLIYLKKKNIYFFANFNLFEKRNCWK